MKGLAEIVIGFCELLEAEGRVALENVYRGVIGCSLIFVAFLFLAGALGFLVAAFYAVLLPVLSPPLVMGACALLCIAICIVLFWIVILWKMPRKKTAKMQTAEKTPNAS